MPAPGPGPSRNDMPALDAADRRLLRRLQEDGRASTQALAEAAGLSSSPAWRRVRRLEAEGVIARHVALLAPERVGLTVHAWVQVALVDHREESLARFDAFVQAEPRILECASVTGAGDYMLKVVAADAADLEEVLMRGLLATGLVRSTATSVALRRIKATTALPV